MSQAAALRRAADREWRRRQKARTAELLATFTLSALANGHGPQLKFTSDTARWILALCSRRAGKTSGVAARKAVKSLAKPDGNRVYIGLTKDQAREVMWEPIWQPMCQTWRLPVEHDETRMVTYFENGSKVRFTGTDDVRHIETELGSALDEATIDESQSQSDSVLKPLVERILPPALGDRLGTLVLAGTIPTVEAGLFWDLWNTSNWSKHNWSQFDNPFMPNAQRDLDEYLEKNPGLTVDSPIIQRERFGRFKFDKDATAYTYNAGLNGYVPTVPTWALGLRVPSGTCMVAEPWAGADSFAFAIDPGANTDRVAVVGWAWSARDRNVQHVFDWASEKAKKHTWAQIAKVCSFAAAHFPGIRWRYDAGSSQNTIDTFGRDYGIPLILAAKKTDLKGQVDRNNDLLTQGRAKVMIGSKLEEDYRKAAWDIDARGRGQYRWAKAWHPDASEAARYALQDYFDLYEAPKAFVRRSPGAIEDEAVQALLERPEENESWMDNDLSRGRF